MGDINKYFSRSEFSCSCNCGFDAVDKELLDILVAIREFFGKAVHLTNACRCLKHNKSIGSKPTSQHVRGKAADIYINGIEPSTIKAFLRLELMADFGGCGLYDTFFHVDVRDNIANWDKRT
jgi:uncharacterized protein YcbK (DUF882 family)